MYVLWYCFYYWCQIFRRRHWHRWKFCSVLILPGNTHVVGKINNLKVRSGQIGSAWEWYHWIGIEKNINRYMFLIFLISLLNIWKDFKVLSRFIQNESTSCLLGLRFVRNPFFLLAGALFFDDKICQRNALFRFGLQDVRFLQIFFSQAVIQRTIFDFPAFLETGLEEKDCSLWPYNP